MGERAAKLMAKLGYTRYAAQGGDWGSGVVSWLGRNDAEHVAGIHLTLVGLGPPDGMENPEEGIPEWELKRTKDRRKWWNGENAYGNIQGTKPQTLGYGLNDSPAGLAAWIIEKWRTWADTKGDIESRFTKERIADQRHDLLDNTVDHVLDPHLLRVAPQPARPRLGRSADGGRDLPGRDFLLSSQVGGNRLQRQAMDRDAPRRAFRRHGRTQAIRRRRKKILPTVRQQSVAEVCGPRKPWRQALQLAEPRLISAHAKCAANLLRGPATRRSDRHPTRSWPALSTGLTGEGLAEISGFTSRARSLLCKGQFGRQVARCHGSGLGPGANSSRAKTAPSRSRLGRIFGAATATVALFGGLRLALLPK